MKDRIRFLLEAQRNFGVGLMVGSLLLGLSERIGEESMWFVFSLGVVNTFSSAILLPVRERNG